MQSGLITTRAIDTQRIVSRPALTTGLIVLSDLLALLLSGALSVWGRDLLGGDIDPALYWRLWPVLGLFLLGYVAIGIHSGVALSPPEELRRASTATTLVYLALGASSFLFRGAEVYSRGVFLMAWVLTLALLPLSRAWVRHLLANRSWWGYPVVVLGAGKTGRMVVRALERQPGIGLKPIALLDDDLEKHDLSYRIPIVGGLELAPQLAEDLGISYAIVAMPGIPRDKLLSLLERHCQTFAHLLVIPDLFGLSSLWVAAKDLGGMLGLEVRQNLLRPLQRLLKRVLDLVGVLVIGVPALPLMGLIALLIKLDSRGPILYSHERVGHAGCRFRIWKFRSMVEDADGVLSDYLERHPELDKQWASDQKLRNDPRITRVGRWLRRTSLDELPQLWNVLKGQMSLVGPRPIVEEEIARYGEQFNLFSQVFPGMTGLWQVSGRNDTTYAERVQLDIYYVRNWSPWLDIYLLARTAWIALTGRGAY